MLHDKAQQMMASTGQRLPAGALTVTLWERSTDLRTSIRLVPGGKVYQNPGWEAP